MGTDCRERALSVSGAGRRAQPGNRNGGDCAERRSLARTGKKPQAAALGEPRRIEQGYRPDAQGRRYASSEGRTGEAQQDFQRDPARLETGEAALLASAEEYRCADRRNRARSTG